MMRLGLLVWVWATVVLVPVGFVEGTVGIVAHSDTLGGLAALSLGTALASGIGMLLTFFAAELKIPAKETRLTREERRRVEDAARRVRLSRAIEEAERREGIG